MNKAAVGDVMCSYRGPCHQLVVSESMGSLYTPHPAAYLSPESLCHSSAPSLGPRCRRLPPEEYTSESGGQDDSDGRIEIVNQSAAIISKESRVKINVVSQMHLS